MTLYYLTSPARQKERRTDGLSHPRHSQGDSSFLWCSALRETHAGRERVCSLVRAPHLGRQRRLLAEAGSRGGDDHARGGASLSHQRDTGGRAIRDQCGDADTLAAMDCELGLHTDFTALPYTEESQAYSAALFRERLGRDAVTNVDHCFIEAGTNAERLRWLAAHGIIGDNGKFCDTSPVNINAFNLTGHGFGFSYPHYIRDDADHGHAVIPCMEIPINYYEPRITAERADYKHPEFLTQYLDAAAENGRIIQLFHHPHYIVRDQSDHEWVMNVFRLLHSHRKTTRSGGFSVDCLFFYSVCPSTTRAAEP